MDSVSKKILSSREIEVLQQICSEKQGKEIADALQISENTLQYHKKNIYNKTQADSLVGLVKYAIRTGIVMP
ncbi:MAG: response regulator transcription factor [Bacteroidetes bacterium]|nr:response regulator transcription factor [Bacteroidota bacterium]